LKLLLDHNLAPRIARALNALFDGEHQIVALRDKFSPNTTDAAWIDVLDQDRGWAVLTRSIAHASCSSFSPAAGKVSRLRRQR
jgi:hypothetical protein